VSNPSILFLDEPTSGLDSRGANIVIRCLKRIAKSGRAVCATIHQPSISIFNSFDSLILMKKGGKMAFFGDIGPESENLIKYFEQYEETPKILEGENPATWYVLYLMFLTQNLFKSQYELYSFTYMKDAHHNSSQENPL